MAVWNALAFAAATAAFASPLPDHSPAEPSLQPQTTATRTAVELSNTVWSVKPDPADVAASEQWAENGLPMPVLDAPVPSTLNDVIGRDPGAAAAGWTAGYFGAVYYETSFVVPRGCDGRVAVRFAAVTFNAKVWVNGGSAGGHSGCCTPWETDDLSQLLSRDGAANRLFVRVDGLRTWQSIPPGGHTQSTWGRPVLLGGDAGYYYSTPGIDGRVHLVCTPANASIADVAVTTASIGDPAGASAGGAAAAGKGAAPSVGLGAAAAAVVHVSLWCRGPACGGHSFRVSVPGVDAVVVPAAAAGAPANATLRFANATLWWPVGSGPGRTPFLHAMRVDLVARAGKALAAAPVDTYTVPVGVRTVTVGPNAVLVNGERVYLRGADTHQDAVLRGHGVDVAAIVANLNTMRSLGMNSFRFNSWPAPEELLNLCDQHGFLVQEEVPGIALRPGWDDACPSSTPGGIFNPSGRCANASTLAAHEAALTELVRRDRNHASVGMWSLANEPLLCKSGNSADPNAVAYFRSLADTARSVDPQRRPVTLELDGTCNDAHKQIGLDLVSIHSYPGWYDLAPIENVTEDMATFISSWAAAVPNKPIIVSEYGAGAVAGNHRDPPVPYTEEFQVAVLRADHAAFDRFRSSATGGSGIGGGDGPMAGEHVHSFHDFEQAGGSNGPGSKTLVTDILGLNYKGLHSRAMDPKAAAAVISARYHALAAEDEAARGGMPAKRHV